MSKDNILGALIVLLLAVILFIFWLYAHAKWKQRRLAENARIAFAEDDQQQEMKAVQRKGLDQAMIDALPIFIYTSIEDCESLESLPGSTAGKGEACSSSCSKPPTYILECSVCLSEFLHQERGRELPICKHRFHVDCIDTWLRANATCPICRASCGASGDGEEEAMHVINGQTSLSSHMGVQYPTNVLFWGSNSRVVSRISIDGQQQPPASSSIIQIYTRELPLDAPSSSSSPSSPPPPSSRISTLNPLRRLLSREMSIGPPIESHSHIVIDSPTHIPKAY